MDKGVRFGKLRITFVTGKSKFEVQTAYERAVRYLYKWAEDSEENIIDTMCEMLNCRAGRA